MNHLTIDDNEAPWNYNECPEKEIEVTVSMTISKTMKIYVDDYSVEVDDGEDGKYLNYDYSNCDLYRAVTNQITLPQNLADFTESAFKHDRNLKVLEMPKYLKYAIEDCRDWNVDDMEITLE